MARVVGMLPVLAIGAACACVPRGAAEPDALYAAVRRASVFVLVQGRHQGSGFFVDPEGLVATAAHMVKGKTDGFEIVSPVAGRLRAERVAIDLGHEAGDVWGEGEEVGVGISFLINSSKGTNLC